MGWFQYYKLYEKYNGNITKATPRELQEAKLGNPNDPISARQLAERKWKEEYNKTEKK